MSQTVDAMGKQCPIPVVMARQALQGMQTPDTLVVLVDNEVAVQNLTKLAGSCHLPVRAEKLGDKRFGVTMDVAAPVTPEPDAEVCLPDQRGDTVIAVFAMGIAGGIAPVASAYLANLAAGVVVAKLGTYAVSREELLKALEKEK